MFTLSSSLKATHRLSQETFDDAYKKLTSQNEHTFYKLPFEESVWQESIAYSKYLKTHFNQLCVIGTGGSSLGTECLHSAFDFEQTNVLFFDNLDPHSFEKKLEKIVDLTKAHFLIVSKSGNTLETMVLANYILQIYQEKNIEISHHFTVITDPIESSLRSFATNHKLKIIFMPKEVGGRFSVFSQAGLVPTGFFCDLENLRKGAIKGCEDLVQLKDLCEIVYSSYQNGDYIHNFWIYSDRLLTFGSWLNQLWSESLGKPLPTPFPLIKICRGSTDQHSYLQQVVEGGHAQVNWILTIQNHPNDLPTKRKNEPICHPWKVDTLKLSEIFYKQAESLKGCFEESKLNTIHIDFSELREIEMGQIIMQWEFIIGLLGEIMGINAFDQPGVEVQKKIFKKIIN